MIDVISPKMTKILNKMLNVRNFCVIYVNIKLNWSNTSASNGCHKVCNASQNINMVPLIGEFRNKYERRKELSEESKRNN